ncbi:MAG: UDP-N-acetylmuramate--L-alanine ligase [Gemmatimonadetes bacterium]|uniref:UDP-N-acetylmuramate--L-alanine ligase n=1 Tax=Candidatus Kutchimonas denitrificans TaxID=3056748 RepID=A0AAE5CBK7_9BACT|nr:UDP-N-acetylmuramate--L-alanine ligase [Gemmatimonadota bacterium]NIR74550.1 UDP-N-acetylmuramate--L-alanine ligase [Candidatus Kutchimonas denitrificans]NIS02740.1 UDP-N-acetylmuramate--L-alanine ligase [Gemmatimonadota bacterium]NIT68901.1 UDP-N-acetylmuramate--L-alanine ligase [Gemmatimonadota bacterium]NIU52206.1 UDP-N-acetylmuramate--L-alanine ligase [Gemmatimonadota bacterium]
MRVDHGIVELIEDGARIHLMGIGGAGMAGLGTLAQALGAAVDGCDLEPGAAARGLLDRGIVVQKGHGPEHVRDCAAVIHTAAVPDDHAELQAARARGIPVVKRSRAMADLVSVGEVIAVGGTHGKTTTTTLVALALEAANLNPTALVGGRVPGWDGNALIGGRDTFVVEADEYDRSFLDLWPKVAVVTSVEAEHLDTYETLTELEKAFDEFVERVPEDGRVVACADDAGARRRLETAGDRGLAYGLGEDADLRAVGIEHELHGTRFTVRWCGDSVGEFELALSGQHNLRNALAAIGVMLALGLEPSVAAPALARFEGVERRFQLIGEAGGVTVIDDYAHHPTEVAATLETARRTFAGRRLLAAFQPHLYSRTQAFADEFGRVLAAADLVFVTAIYPAREPPIPGVTAHLVVEAARELIEADRVRETANLDELFEALRAELRAGDVLITMGAGDVFQVAHRVARELEGSHVDA